MTAIVTRMSVRNFRPAQIPGASIAQITNTGTYAPSALALNLWAFVVVQDQDFHYNVSAYCTPRMIAGMKNSYGGISDPFRELLETPGYPHYYHAPTVIMLVGKPASRLREADVSLCAENRMLSAHAMGIGSCRID
jgi:nitroreductase